MAEATMDYWDRLFTNEGHGTLHDPRLFKRNLQPNLQPTPMTGRGGGGDRGEVMQIEAGMAAAAAILDFLVHVRRGVHYLFQGAPSTWRDASFTGIRTEGGFLVSARRENGTLTQVEIRATRAATFRLRNPWPSPFTANAKPAPLVADTFETTLAAGESLILKIV
jgi:alpha-L-fucosidase 2